MEGWRDGGMEGRKEGRKEGRREGGKEGRREGGKEGRKVRKGGREGEWEGGRERGREGRKRKGSHLSPVYSQGIEIVFSLRPPLVAIYILGVLVRVLQRGELTGCIYKER